MDFCTLPGWLFPDVQRVVILPTKWSCDTCLRDQQLSSHPLISFLPPGFSVPSKRAEKSLLHITLTLLHMCLNWFAFWRLSDQIWIVHWNAKTSWVIVSTYLIFPPWASFLPFNLKQFNDIMLRPLCSLFLSSP